MAGLLSTVTRVSPSPVLVSIGGHRVIAPALPVASVIVGPSLSPLTRAVPILIVSITKISFPVAHYFDLIDFYCLILRNCIFDDLYKRLEYKPVKIEKNY